ncbi:Magnesium-transporting ATPase, P-type 1 [Raoultella terrigena]|uniref:Magnesium-transporting ATPase, P-type 1 n=1 Tax=Raoultella terrigena TaxID=577 RepID=A0A4U9CZ32_RAOTE|nr:Magnesium-transporting ATPase, P-type 1 [Raoultella terrigena]
MCKGAVEEMLSIATQMEENGKVVTLDNQRRDAMLAMTNDYNKDGFRVLVVATRDIAKVEAKKQYGHRR